MTHLLASIVKGNLILVVWVEVTIGHLFRWLGPLLPVIVLVLEILLVFQVAIIIHNY